MDQKRRGLVKSYPTPRQQKRNIELQCNGTMPLVEVPQQIQELRAYVQQKRLVVNLSLSESNVA